ncbi:MAG TPA: hypothetical protein VFS00_31035, partial [Polyangiaceae bacterium]|nr:hypothetical protein [Polyangiaceae bacterium]
MGDEGAAPERDVKLSANGGAAASERDLKPSANSEAAELERDVRSAADSDAADPARDAPPPASRKGAAPRGPSRAQLAGVALAALVAGTALAHVLEESSSEGKVLRGVTLGGAPLAGLAGPALETAVAHHADVVAARRLTLRAGTHAAETSVGESGFAVDVPATTAAALRAGREGSWPARWVGWLGRFARPRELAPVGRFDEAKAEAAFDALDAALPERPLAGAVRAPDGRVEAEYPRPGSILDRPAARELLLARLPLGDASLTLPLQARPAPLPREAVDEALARARQVFAGPLALVSADGARRVDWTPAELGAALTSRPAPGGAPRLELGFSPEALEAKLAPLRPALDEDSVEARFEV